MTPKYLLVVTCALLISVAACVGPADERRQPITIKGSDTMVQLGQRWAEVFMNSHPGVVVQVTGGGSGTGIAALINGTTQICQASRAMTEEEKQSIKTQRNVDVMQIPVALDALAVYVNRQNPIEQLTLEQAGKIFKGEITNWKDVGGPDAGIVLYGRENSSGTYVYFKEHVLANADFAEKYQGMPGTGAVVNAVTQDPNGIGYGGIGYATDVKTLSIATDASSPAIAPSMENVFNNSYPLSRELYWYIAGPAEGETREFVDWVLGSEGQKIVTEADFYPLRAEVQIQR
jgi:phosphate transport system substrate-binding protein